MVLKKLLFAALLFLCLNNAVFSQNSPPDLNSDILWDENPSTAGNQQTYANKTAIENAFNNARRMEESASQKNLTVNALGFLSLPSNFTSLSEDVQAFILLNAERTCRAGVSYSGVIASGLPLEAIENTIDGVSQAHMDWMIANNVWSHTGAGGLSPFQRINNAVGTSCRESISYGENLAAFGSSSSVPPMLVAQSMYNWIYVDAGSAWGHRRACLYQGFNNNRNSASSEGYFGWASGGKNDGSYTGPFGAGSGSIYPYQYATVMNFFDPAPSGCSYILPVELLTFNAKAQNNNIELSWTTTEEINLKGYEIERSEDGKNFKTIDFVAPKAQKGKMDYSFLDPSVKPHFVYFYRLRMVDYDEKFSHSPIRSAMLKGQKTSLSVYPNPTNGIVHITTGTDSDEQIEITNLMGEVVLKTTIIDAKSLDLSTLSAGIYVIRTSNGVVQRVTKY